jgi:hypothetical protein
MLSRRADRARIELIERERGEMVYSQRVRAADYQNSRSARRIVHELKRPNAPRRHREFP